MCEVPVALISACLPSIFNLAKHGIQSRFPRLYVALNGSHPRNISGGKSIEPVSSSTDYRKEKGFVQLLSDKSMTMNSTKRPYDGGLGASHLTTVFPSSLSRETAEEHLELRVKMNQIHVRNEIDVNSDRSV